MKVKREDSFSNVFIKEKPMFQKYQQYLKEYFTVFEEEQDPYLMELYIKIKAGGGLSESQIIILDGVMENVSVEELLVESLLAGGNPIPADLKSDNEKLKAEGAELKDMYSGVDYSAGWDVMTAAQKDLMHRIEKVNAIAESSKKLRGWDYTFVFGKENGRGLLEQFKKRKRLTAKQLIQFERIEENLRGG